MKYIYEIYDGFSTNYTCRMKVWLYSKKKS